MPLPAGTKLDGYEVLGLLGSGGMGEVYRARDPVLKREVAIKVLPPFVSGDPDRLRRFEQEAQATAALNHPNILAVYHFGVGAGSPYLVSELLVGETLRQLLERGPLAVRKAIDCGMQIAHGLAAAHDKGIVHRDLKPENLFVTKEGRIKILDFGLAKLIQRGPVAEGSDPTLTHGTEPGLAMGTAGYMSPEQVRGTTVDHRADIFAYGAILYEMLTGRPPFDFGGNHDRHPQRSPAGGFPDPAERSSRIAASCLPLPREESRAAVSIRIGSGVRSGISVGIGIIFGCPARSDRPAAAP